MQWSSPQAGFTLLYKKQACDATVKTIGLVTKDFVRSQRLGAAYKGVSGGGGANGGRPERHLQRASK